MLSAVPGFFRKLGKKRERAGINNQQSDSNQKGDFMERNDFFKACQSRAIGKTVTVEYDSIAYYPIAYQLAYNADGTVRHTAVLQDVKSKSLVYCRLQDVQGKI